MLRNLFLLVPFLLLVHVASAVALPPCPTGSSAYFHNCEGLYDFGDGRTYEGEWRDGKYHGRGILVSAFGDRYKGEFKDGVAHGQGFLTYADGRKYVGEYKDDMPNGQGTYTYADGRKYVGEWKDGKWHGQGTYTYADGRKYVGEFKDGKWHGQGTVTYADGSKYVGEFKDDKYHGQGTYTYADGTVESGIWEDGELVQRAVVQVASWDEPVGELGPRFALVIGNGSYSEAPLSNPPNDSQLMAETLRGLGFTVSLLNDVTQNEMKTAIVNFGIQLEDNGSDAIGLFYYAGHGVQVRGQNYLMPVSMPNIGREADVDIFAVGANEVLDQMYFAGNSMNIVILDACRNNPYTRGFRGTASRGLAQMDAPTGTIVAYSTRPGDLASDGTGRYSPYTEALTTAMQLPGLSLSDIFIQTRVAVMAATNEAQVPWEEGGLTAKFYFKPVALTEPQLPSAPVAADNTAEVEFWVSAENTGTAEAYEDYLIRFPGGLFAELAQARLEKNFESRAVLVSPSGSETIGTPGTEMIGTPGSEMIEPPGSEMIGTH